MKKDDVADVRRRDGRASTGVRSMMTDVEQQTRAFVDQRPVVAVLAAVGLGYLLARIAARV